MKQGAGNRSIDIASLVFFRIAFGGLLCWQLLDYFRHDWIRQVYIEPAFHFFYFGFEWVAPWPGVGMQLHFGALLLCAILILVGFCYRLAAAVLFVGYTALFLMERTQYNNHYYLICLLSGLLIFLPCHRAVALDALLKPKLRSSRAPSWALNILRFQMAVVYLFGAVAKMNSDWLFRAEPLGHWVREFFASSALFSAPDSILQQPYWGFAFSWAGMLFDLLIVPLLLWPRSRRLALYAAIWFHLINTFLFNLGIFPLLAMALTLMFLPSDWPRTLLRRWGCLWKSAAEPTTSFALGRAGSLALGLFVAVQLSLPLRPFLYPGNVLWTEEGYDFSWHMKISRKEAAVEWDLRAAGRPVQTAATSVLTEDQYRSMAMKPDLLLQFAHFLGRQLRREGHTEVEVRARTHVSLNGRPPQLLVDPDQDLLKVKRSLLACRWLVALQEQD
jgi:hypothetical protein